MKNIYRLSLVLATILIASCTKNTPPALSLTPNIQPEAPPSHFLYNAVETDPFCYDFSTLSEDGTKKLFKELQDSQTLEYIASVSGLSQTELNCIDIVFQFDEIFESLTVNLYLTNEYRTDANAVNAFNKLYKIIEVYIQQRCAGHTREYITAVLNADTIPEPDNDPELKDMFRIYPDILHAWVQKVNEEEVELHEGTSRQVNFVIIDGDIAWRYPILYNPDGTVEECIWGSGRCDAKEYDPKYKDIIRKAEQQADERMDRENITGIGAVHAFWDYKKEYLEKRGIDWKSPSDLNPGTFFD